uniref:Pr1-like protein n=1 Tax=Oryza sativa subsp. indica TaxID=39946 RepID=C8TF21_ORYSI|nr:pr1-like protein [Oryza sativa Indica Group]
MKLRRIPMPTTRREMKTMALNRSYRGGGARGPGPREWGPRGSLTVHGGPGATGLTPAGAAGPTRQPHPRARAADGWAPRGSRSARPKAATSARPAGGGAPAPLWSPAAAIGTVDGDGGTPAVGELDEGVDGDGGGAAKPEKATPGRETVPVSRESRPKVVGDGGERGRRRELDSGEEKARQRVETGEGARVVGGPARQRRARGEGPNGPRGKRREGEGNGPSRPKRGRGKF